MWITWAVYVVPFLFFDWEDPANKCVSFINEDLPIYVAWPYAIFMLSILLTLFVTYVHVWRVANTHATHVRGNPSESSTSSSHGAQIPQIIQQNTNKESRKGLKFIVAAIGACLLTWSMSFCVRIAGILHPELTTWEPWLAIKFTSIVIAFSNSAINIFIYSCYLSEFRKAYRKILCCCVERQNQT